MPGVGAVGAKLLYADGRFSTRGSSWAHMASPATPSSRGRTDPNSEYLYYAHVARNYLAVTAACMLSHKTAFEAVGGFNRARPARWAGTTSTTACACASRATAWSSHPYALLYHLESQSARRRQGPDGDPLHDAHWRRYIDGTPFTIRTFPVATRTSASRRSRTRNALLLSGVPLRYAA